MSWTQNDQSAGTPWFPYLKVLKPILFYSISYSHRFLSCQLPLNKILLTVPFCLGLPLTKNQNIILHVLQTKTKLLNHSTPTINRSPNKDPSGYTALSSSVVAAPLGSSALAGRPRCAGPAAADLPCRARQR